MEIADKELAFFTVCDDGYLAPSLVAIQSIRDFYPESAIFVGGHFDDVAMTMRVLNSFGLSYFPIDLANTFTQPHIANSSIERWSVACFGHFSAYRHLLNQGFRYSCYFDGDILCVKKFDTKAVFDPTVLVSAVMQGDGWINSGVLFYNHLLMQEYAFFERTLHYYRNVKTCSHESCLSYCCEMGDQELLMITLERDRMPWRKLSSAYNYFLPYPESLYRQRNLALRQNAEECVFLHLMLKPWMERPAGVQLYPMMSDAYDRWTRIASRVVPKIRMIIDGPV